MERQNHHDRTLRLLECRLEVLAGASERSLSGRRPLDRQVLAVEAATRHAIDLELLSREEADEIWAAVARRHPLVRWCQGGPGLAA
ncbi:MAG: hypothetical protein M3265_11190 [Actinomycetota bacterium]|jgi:hypothetical protein|nr:hypothetical protein [Actinomycetota bacterium]